ncbi:MAG: hypothetical protein ACXU9U_01670 [Parachlamydiaceae bacterium]
MRLFLQIFKFSLIFPILSSSLLMSETLIYRTPEGNISTVEVSTESSFSDVITLMRSNAIYEQDNSIENSPSNELLVDFIIASNDTPQFKNIHSKSAFRQYNAPLTPSEKKKIAHTVETLGNASLISIARAKSSLEKEGAEIEHIHPLNFLSYIFSEEKLKAALHNIRGRGWIWSKFFKGLKEGLENEYKNNNLLPYIADFSRQVKINPKKILPLAEKQRWKDFVEMLLIEIPRPETAYRYDM